MRHSLKFITAAGAALALVGCLNGAETQSEARIAQEKRVEFINESSMSVAEAAGLQASNPFHDEIVKSLDALGCPKLSRLFTDLLDYQGSVERPLPASFVDYLACFGVSGSGTPDDIDVVYAKFEDPVALLDCICGGSGLSELLEGKIELFSVQASAAAEAFSASNSKPADTYNGSSTKPADVYNGSSSKPADTFSN